MDNFRRTCGVFLINKSWKEYVDRLYIQATDYWRSNSRKNRIQLRLTSSLYYTYTYSDGTTETERDETQIYHSDTAVKDFTADEESEYSGTAQNMGMHYMGSYISHVYIHQDSSNNFDNIQITMSNGETFDTYINSNLMYHNSTYTNYSNNYDGVTRIFYLSDPIPYS